MLTVISLPKALRFIVAFAATDLSLPSAATFWIMQLARRTSKIKQIAPWRPQPTILESFAAVVVVLMYKHHARAEMDPGEDFAARQHTVALVAALQTCIEDATKMYVETSGCFTAQGVRLPPAPSQQLESLLSARRGEVHVYLQRATGP